MAQAAESEQLMILLPPRRHFTLPYFSAIWNIGRAAYQYGA